LFGGEGKPEDRPIYRSDIDKPTPYNTYTIPALPPGPIANPGKAALEAVANPSRTDELFFVANGTGGHAFAKTLDEHNENVRRWREIEAARKKEADEAAENFMSQLHSIQNRNETATVFVILDGENAWEFYKHNGFDFFASLYGALEKASWCKTITMEEVKSLPSRELVNLAPGSWINGSFDTWVGEYEKTRAWEFLFLAKKDYEHHQASLSDAIKAKITEHFLQAECSDWFWWYGSDHYTDFSLEFDAIFRRHLINIYHLLGIGVPNYLFIPIVNNQSSTKFWIKPQSKITPKIDGKRDSFFEWMGCGVIDESRLFSTMQTNTQPVKKIYYGQDDNRLYFAFEGDIKALCKKGIMTVIVDPLGVSVAMSLHQKEQQVENILIKSACNEWLEISIEKKMIQQKKIWLRFEIAEGSTSLQTLPSFGELEIDLQDDYAKNWFI